MVIKHTYILAIDLASYALYTDEERIFLLKKYLGDPKNIVYLPNNQKIPEKDQHWAAFESRRIEVDDDK